MRIRNLRSGAALLVVGLVAGAPGTARTQEPASVEQQLRRELEGVKETLRRVEQKMKEQDELIRKFSGEKPSPPTPAAPAPVPAAPPPGFDEDKLRLKILDEVQRTIQPQLAAATRTFPSQFNPAISFVIDTLFFYSANEGTANFEFRSGEMGIFANVDPFARAYAFINGTPDGVELEEAAIITTALPYDLTVKGGRFFADFGRLSKFHDHDLPFVNRPIVLDTYVDGESQADGVEVSWLAPLPVYLNITGGWYNKVGAENERVDNLVPRRFDEFTYLGRAATFFSLTDEHSIDLGISDAYTPTVVVDDDMNRNLLGVDLTYRYTPLATAGYRGVVWGSEFLWNHEAREAADFEFQDALGMYTYLEGRWTRRFYTGFLFEWVEELDDLVDSTKAYSPYITFWPSDFHRLRFQYTHLDSPDGPDNQFFLQWTVVMGSHVHSFRDR
jgi:hypothetical protein